jgi:uncharacterized protein YceH (UPF0502 family)
MTGPTPESPRTSPRWSPLDARLRRVLGVLIEKAKTTPAAYPMSVNAIAAGCNQKNNRDPLMTLSDLDVENALDELRTLGAVSELDWVGRVPKYKHHAYEWLGVSKAEIAVMTELLLRGAQALGELRGRAARMEPIADLAALRPIVASLLERGLMIELTPSGRGQIVSHNLCTPGELAEMVARFTGRTPSAATIEDERPAPRSSPRTSESAAAGAAADEVAGLSAEVTELRSEVARLREIVRDLEAKLTQALG